MSTTTATADQAPLFKEFAWVPPRRQRGPYDMLSDVRDIAGGVCLALKIIERSQISAESDEAPLIDNCDAGRLMRMAIAALHFVEGRIDSHFEHLADPDHHPATESARGDK